MKNVDDFTGPHPCHPVQFSGSTHASLGIYLPLLDLTVLFCFTFAGNPQNVEALHNCIPFICCSFLAFPYM